MDFPKSVPGVGLVGGRYVNEGQATGQAGTLVVAEAMNAFSDEILAVIRQAGIEPDESNNAQLLAAIQKLQDERWGEYVFVLIPATNAAWPVPEVFKSG